jgi:hypothetical protein
VLEVVTLSNKRFIDSRQFLVVGVLAKRRAAKLLALESYRLLVTL